MVKLKESKSMVLLAPVLALLLAGVVIAGSLGGGDQNSDIEPDVDRPGGDDDCICPHIYDPVVCVQPSIGPITEVPTYVTYSNSCFAACDGYTRCRPAPAEVR